MKFNNEFLEKIKNLNIEEKYEELIASFSIIELESLKNSELCAEFAEAYWNLSKISDCEKVAKMALDFNENNAKAYNYLGHVSASRNRFEQAKDYYLKSLKIESNYYAPLNGLGTICYDKKDFVNAEIYFKKAIALKPTDNLPYYNIGIINVEKKNYSKAEKYFKKSLDLKPRDINSLNELGKIKFTLESFDESEVFFKDAVLFNKDDPEANYWLGLLSLRKSLTNNARKYFEQVVKKSSDKSSFYFHSSSSKLAEIPDLKDDSLYFEVKKYVDNIKALLLFKGKSITHYTSLSTLQNLLLNNNSFRLSEGSFLNDTSEGNAFYDFLDFKIGLTNNIGFELFTERPFIGSFVSAEKCNDLTLWRMYGKEGLEEAKGCSITFEVSKFREKINEKINFNGLSEDINQDAKSSEFFNVAYLDNKEFSYFGADKVQIRELNNCLLELKKVLLENKKKAQKIEKDLVELLNEIAYLFKSSEYQYENEIRMVIDNSVGFDIKLDFEKTKVPYATPRRVYIELIPVSPLIEKIVLGPKVEKAEEWASSFYYNLSNSDFSPQVLISTLPFK